MAGAKIQIVIPTRPLLSLTPKQLHQKRNKANPPEDFYYEEKEDGTLWIGYVGDDSDVVVPSEIDGKVVTEILSQGFYYKRDKIRSVTHYPIPLQK